MSEPAALQSSRRFCRRLTRGQAKNFYWGLKLLPPEKREAMFALYAYMRIADDIADAAGPRDAHERTMALEAWRAQTHEALAGRIPSSNGQLIWPAFAEMARKHQLPPLIFDEVIAGQRQDLGRIAFEDWQELYQYCYRVAGVVGLACVHIWGFEGGQPTLDMAVDRGVAFQLTNILRDLREDTSRGRRYLPRRELTDLHMTDSEPTRGERFNALMQMQIQRAESYYDRSADLEDRISPDCRPTLVAMTAIYRGILEKVKRRPECVLDGRVSLSLPSKLLIGWRAVRQRRGGKSIA